jgi:hypothetical protein
MTSQYGAYALHAEVARLYARMCTPTPTRSGTRTHARTHARASMHTQTNMKYLLLFHSNNGFANAPQFYVIRTLPVFYTILTLTIMCNVFFLNHYSLLTAEKGT